MSAAAGDDADVDVDGESEAGAAEEEEEEEEALPEVVTFEPVAVTLFVVVVLFSGPFAAAAALAVVAGRVKLCASVNRSSSPTLPSGFTAKTRA